MRHGGDTPLGCRPADDGAASRYRGTEGSPPFRLVALSRKTVRDGLSREADFSYWQCYEGFEAIRSPADPIAQLDRVADFYSAGCRFESCWDRQ
jgi:hypothetical protein